MIRFLQTPGRAKKIVLGGLLLIICAAMVITLVPGGMLGDAFGFGFNEAGVIAKIGGETVSVTDVQNLANRMAKQRFPRGYPSELRPLFMQQAAQDLIQEKALVAEAGRLGFQVTDQEFLDFLRHSALGAQLFRNGAPIPEDQYESFIQQAYQMTVPQFEQAVKTSLLVGKLRSLVEGGVSVSQADLQDEYKQENTKAKFEYAVITNEQLRKEIKPTEAELKAYYESHKQQFQNSIPEKREVRYVVVDSAKLAKELPITQDEVLRYYNSHQDQYRVPEQINVRHILIKTPVPGPDGKVDPKAVEAARAKAEDILKKLKGGGNFEELAKQYSEDEASKANGGSIGWIQRGRTDPEFEKAAFALPKGGTSDVVRSSYGFHIIHADDKQTAHVKPLADVRPEIEAALRQEKVGNRAQALATRIENQARTAGLEKSAKDNGLQMLTSGFIARADTLPEVGSAPEVMDAVFSAQANTPPDAVQTAQGWVIYQVMAVKPPATPTYEEVKSQVENQFKGERAGQLLAQKTQELSDRARAEHNLKKAAAALGATLKTSELVKPSDQVPDIGAMSGPASVVFTMKPGDISGPINTGSNGVVLSLLEKQEPAPADFESAKEGLRETLLARKRSEVMDVFAANLRTRMEKDKTIRINQQEWNRITAREAGS